jgi:hypothetical protein
MDFLRVGGMATLLSVAVAVGVPAADGRTSGDPADAQAIKRRATHLIQRADRLVRHANPSCGIRSPGGSLRLGEGGAGPLVRSVLGVFRRPATAEEQALALGRLADRAGSSYGDATLPRDGVRVVSDGLRKVVLTALRDVPSSEPDRPTYDRCTSLLAHEIARLAPTVSPAVAARARHVEHVLRRNGRPPAHQPRSEAVITGETTAQGTAVVESGAMSFDPALFRRTGTAVGSSARGRTRWTFVVPDGVATIDATFGRVVRRGAGRPGKRVATTIRRTLTVHDNVAFVTLVHGKPDVSFPRMVWRAADGGVVRRLPAP